MAEVDFDRCIRKKKVKLITAGVEVNTLIDLRQAFAETVFMLRFDCSNILECE